MDLLSWIADERRDAADLIDSLTGEQAALPSLCTAWSIHDVAAHLLMPLVTPFPRFLLALAASRFDFDRANIRLTSHVARSSRAQIAAGLREHARSAFHPPGLGLEAPLTDLLVHQQDIRRPLGLAAPTEPAAPDRLRVALDFLASPPGRRLAGKEVIEGLRYVVDDPGWTCGSGAVVRGGGEAVMMVLAGRPAALAELEGDGVPVLRARLAHRAGPAAREPGGRT